MAKNATHPKKDDLDAFEQIVAAHEAAVRAFIAVRMEDPIEAHDLAQEVFLLLWRRLEEIDVDRPLRPWLLTVAMNLVRGHSSVTMKLHRLRSRLMDCIESTLQGALP